MLADSGKSKKEENPEVQLTAQDKKKTFIVYAGSFKDKKNAISRVRELRKHGYPSFRFLNKSESDETLHNVVAGQYDSLKKAREAKENISSRGYGSFIVEY